MKRGVLPIEDWKSIINEAIEISVEKHVNGKIRNLDSKVAIYIDESKRFHEKVEKHIEKSEKESEALKPLIERAGELSNLGDAVKTANGNYSFVKWVGSFWKETTFLIVSIWAIIKLLGTYLLK